MLRFQMSKFRLGSNYTQLFEKTLFEATHSHLQDLYQELIAPFRERLNAKHLTIVPHGILHYLPFHALFDGTRYLIDDVFNLLCAEREYLRALLPQRIGRVGSTAYLGCPRCACSVYREGSAHRCGRPCKDRD